MNDKKIGTPRVPPPAPRVDRVEEGYCQRALHNEAPGAKSTMREKLLKLMAWIFRVPYHPPPGEGYGRGPLRPESNANAMMRKLIKLEPAHDANALLDVRPLLERMIAAYSPDTVSVLLGVDKAALQKWQTGEREIPLAFRSRVLDMHDALTRVHFVFTPNLAVRWLTGHEPLLGGARPIDVLVQRGATPLIQILDAIVGGGFA